MLGRSVATAPPCNEVLFRELVETLPLVTYVVSSGPGGRTLYVSPQMEQLLGYAAEDWLDDPDFFAKVAHPEDRERVVRETEARRVRDDTSTRFRVVASDGRVITVQSELVVKRDDFGDPSHVFGFWIDISERVRLGDELRQAQKLEAVGRLAGGVAHDFNNVLLAQRGYGELAVQHLQRGEAQAAQDAVGEMLAAADRGANLTHQLLAFARRQMLDVEVLDLNAVVAELEGLLRTLIGETIGLELQLATTPVLVSADRGQVEQLITNLAVNARDAMPDGGELRLSLTLADRAQVATLEVADTGTGMDAATAARIFEPYFTTKGAGGTGLGLATVHGIVTQNGGEISVRSAPAEGTTFVINLRTTDLPATARPDPQAPERSGVGIILVEDDEAVRTAVAAMLGLSGYRIYPAADADDALRVAGERASEVDLLVTDVIMPGRSGPAVAELVRAVLPELPVLYMSGHTDDVRLPRLGPGTRSAFIQKPFSVAELAQAITELIAGVPV